MSEPVIRDLVNNRRATFDYELSDRFEAGLALLGPEVKSLRAGKGNLQEGFVRIDERGAWLVGCHISPYVQAGRNNADPLRVRQLLLHDHEISKLRKATTEKGMTIVPVRLYLKGSRVKLEIAVGRGKKNYDKRQSLKAKAARRDLRHEH